MTRSLRRRRTPGRGLLAIMSLLALLFPLLAHPATPAAASSRPGFQLPFPCGEVWRGATNHDHPTGSGTHLGLDLNWGSGSADLGRPVVASAAGTVATVVKGMVTINHGGGWRTDYIHVQNAVVTVGQPVAAGQRIAEVGGVGVGSRSPVTPHLHYEQRLNGALQHISFDGQFITYSFVYNGPEYISRNCPAAAPAGSSPVGVFDTATGTYGGKLRVTGWAYDPDNPTAPVTIHVYVGGPAGIGQGHNIGVANKGRDDVGNAYPGAGNYHGYDYTLTGIAPGDQTVYVYAINAAGGGGNPLLGTRTTHVPGGSPVAVFDSAGGTYGGKMRITGWAYDPDDPTVPVSIHVYVGGPAGVGQGFNLGPANKGRADVGNAYPGVGNYHGFDSTLTGIAPGNHTVYVYAINAAGGGGNPLFGTRTVNVPGGSPVGVFDAATGLAGGTAHVAGWAFDPDDPSEPVIIHAYVDGPAGVGRGFNVGPANTGRGDVGAVYGVGNYHGFSAYLSGLAPGNHSVYIYALNMAGAGGNPLLGVRQITVE
jgi:hypothetical protein